VLLAALFLARLAFILLMPETYSTDLYSWLKVMEILDRNGNPYRETGVLNWPPFWMQILFGIHQVAKHLHVSATHLVQATLIFGEALVLTVVYAMGRRLFDGKRLFGALLWGIALNPVAIFLSCQHCNYDVFVGLFVLVAVWMLIEWSTRETREAWLAACFFIGMGILAKTVPVILTPLLLIGFRRLPVAVRCFGIVLLAAPFTIGMSVLFALEPHGVMEHVVGYRSLAGWYGITGLLSKAGWPEGMELYQKISPLLFIAIMVFMAWRSYRSELPSAKGVLVQALLLVMFIPTFGPGYSPPYLLWYLPLAIIFYTVSERGMRRFLLLGWVILCLTYTTEYALFESHGAFLSKWYPSAALSAFGEEAGSRGGQTVIRLPMFLFYLIIFGMLAKRLRYSRRDG
jgi:hypothetical protein